MAFRIASVVCPAGWEGFTKTGLWWPAICGLSCCAEDSWGDGQWNGVTKRLSSRVGKLTECYSDLRAAVEAMHNAFGGSCG